MKLVIFTISVVLACVAVLGQPLQENNGNEVAIKNHPYLVSIQKPTGQFCSGSIISNRFVLSAATCFDEKRVSTPKRLLTIHAGNNGSVHRIAKIIPHEEYSYDEKNLTSKNNLALIEVEDPFIFDETHQPIQLFDEEVQPVKMGIVSNWFNIGELGTRKDQLFSASLAVIDRQTCYKLYDSLIFPRPNEILENQICATLQRDDEGFKSVGAGSPLVIDGRVAGVASFFTFDDTPVIFSNIAYYRNWIVKYARLN